MVHLLADTVTEQCVAGSIHIGNNYLLCVLKIALLNNYLGNTPMTQDL